MDMPSELQIQFPDISRKKVIIAMKGLPSTGKSDIAAGIGRWARCQVCYIDDFLGAFSLERGHTTQSPPSGDEADRLHRLAFHALCRAALRYLHLSASVCVVIKSRLCSTFEIDLLMRMVNNINCYYEDTRIIIIIIECQIKNKYRWPYLLEFRGNGQKYVWYKAGSWKDIEKAMDDDNCLDSQAWDLHLLSSLKAKPISSPRRVTRLVLDPFWDLQASQYYDPIQPTLDFLDAIKYLLIDEHEYLEDLDEDQDHSIRKLALYKGGYKALQYDELRRDLLEMELRTSIERSNYLCTSKTTKAGSCVLKYCQVLLAACDAESSCCCRACGVRVASGQPAYTCHFCILTLHKSCAEKLDFDFRNHKHDLLSSLSFNTVRYEFVLSKLQEKHACRSCMEGGKNFSSWCESCLFETHLKGGMLPTIINHDCHQLHFLSIQFPSNENYSCKACGMAIWLSENYVCHICNFFYHMRCVFMPVEVKHEHGGYEHVMKLLYSHDATEAEDDHWCNVCYQDMDPQAWFYSCQECPYYITHASGNCVGYKNIEEAMDSGKLPIQLIRDKLKVDKTS